MDEITIKGKTFSNNEIIEYGKKHIKKLRTIFRWIGIGLLIFSVIYVFGTISDVSDDSSKIATAVTGIIGFFVPGIVFLIISLKKRDPYKEGINYLNRHFPDPVGFDGNVIELLDGDKLINLNRNDRMTVSTKELKFQIMQDKKFSKIISGADIKEYEIKVNNELIITSNTKNKKGVGKAVVGGLLFGGVGAIAGAAAANSKAKTSETQKEVQHYTLALKVNDIIKPSFTIELSNLSVAEEVSATLLLLSDKNTEDVIEEDTEDKNVDNNKIASNKFEEIKNFKELLDAGIITQEEFDQKKKELFS